MYVREMSDGLYSPLTYLLYKVSALRSILAQQKVLQAITRAVLHQRSCDLA